MRKNVLLILIILWVLLIFANSLQPGETSATMSGYFVSLIYDFFTWIGLDIDPSILSIVIRKTAHVLQFMILAIMLFFYLLEYLPFSIKMVVLLLSISMLIGVIDETIQLHIDGRVGSIVDVGFDFLGSVIGLLVGIVFKFGIFKRKKKQKKP